jgi:hypothetical protein
MVCITSADKDVIVLHDSIVGERPGAGSGREQREGVTTNGQFAALAQVVEGLLSGRQVSGFGFRAATLEVWSKGCLYAIGSTAKG